MPPKKPWDDERYKPKVAKSSGPLVPKSALSAPTQRFIVTSLFFLLQGLKLASPKTIIHFVGYTALDVAFVAYLPVLGIPRFNFKKNVVNVQILLLLLLNYSLFIDSRWLILALWALTRPLAWLLGLSSTKTVSTTGYIKGKYVVDILPEASAKLDIIGPLCVDPNNKQPIYMRLSVENTWPSMVALSRAQLGNTSNYENLSFSKRQLSKMPSEAGKLYLPVTQPGAYYLNGITDEQTGLRVKIQRDRIVIPPCPSVKLLSLSDPSICEKQQLKAEIVATGVMPLKMLVDGNWLTLGEPSEEDAVSEVRYLLDKVGIADTVSITAGSISDALGTQSKHQVDSQVSARVLTSPTVKFVRDLNVAKVGPSVEAHILITGSKENQPFNMTLEKPDGTLSEFTIRTAGQHKLGLSDVGKYKLKSLSGSKCEGRAEGEVEVFEPPQVSVQNTFEVIQDKCAGPTGVNAHLTFEGTAPFKVRYRTLKSRRVVNDKVATFTDKQGVVQFLPKDVGEYTYEITSVEDKYREIQPDLSTTQRITELPGAHFGEFPVTKLCGSSKLTAEVITRGRGPFTLNYKIDDKTSHKITTHDTTDSAKILLDLDLPAGSHFIRLTSLTDRNGCVTDLGGVRSPSIEVIPKIAHIGLAQPGSYQSSEPVDFNLPLVGEDLTYPATLVFEHEFQGKKSRYQTTLASAQDMLHSNKPGVWRLVSLDDGRCGGTVEPDQEVEIKLYERPVITFSDNDLNEKGYCFNDKVSSIRAKLSGEAPFTVIHEVLDPNNKSKMKTHKVSAEEAEFEIESSIPGEYKHFFWILDKRYPEFNRNQYVALKHRVWAPAEVSFIKNKNSLRMCENSESPASLPLSLKGDFPLLLDVQMPSEQIKQYVLESPSDFELKFDSNSGFAIGNNKMQILRVQDANGCVSSASSMLNRANVEVLAAPQEPALKKTDYCVGEKVSIPIHGHGSQFTVEYSWSNKRRSAKVNGHNFETYVNSPGTLTLTSVKDEQGCARKTDLTAQVHQLPSSIITEEPHFSIYQGDKISLGFAFKGTAPFSFVYTRSVNGQVKETKTVRDVMEDVYTIIVDEVGEYEIIELRDKYCHSHR